jgi:hypothetical protein
MQELEKAIKEPRMKVEVQVLPCARKAALEKQNVVLNHESQDDLCVGKIILAITSEGSKLTKADAGRMIEFSEEVFVTTKITSSEIGQMPNIEITISEKCGSKLTKADAGKA